MASIDTKQPQQRLATPEEVAEFHQQLLSQGYSQEALPEVIYVQQENKDAKNIKLRSIIRMLYILQIALLAVCIFWTVVCFLDAQESAAAVQAGWVFLLLVVGILMPLTLATIIMAIILLATSSGSKADKKTSIFALILSLAPTVILVLIMVLPAAFVALVQLPNQVS